MGLSIPVLGVLGLFALSNSLRDLVGDTLGGIEGVVVLSDNAISPVLSNVPASLADELRKMPRIRAVAPEIWGLAPSIEGRGMIAGMFTPGKKMSIFDQPVIAGQDIVAHQNLRSAVFPRALHEHGEGRFLQPGDEGQPNIVISRKIAASIPTRRAGPGRSATRCKISGKPFTIVGLYETGSMLLDVVIIMDIDDGAATSSTGPKARCPASTSRATIRRGTTSWSRRSRRPIPASTPAAWTRPRPTSAP